MTPFKPEYNYHKHFIVRMVDRGNADLEALQVTDAFSNRCIIYLKDKRAVRDLINQLMIHEKDFTESEAV